MNEHDHPRTCPTCGTAVRVVSGHEGTSRYEPLAFTAAERERLLWWLHRPVPPGELKTLDEAIIRKLR